MTAPKHHKKRQQSDPERRRTQPINVIVNQEVESRHPVSSPQDSTEQRQLHPLPRGLVELYGLIAVLVVLIPEWIADGTLSLGDKKSRSNLPMASRAWRTLPELQLASMNLAALRQLGRQLRVWGYAGESRDRLTSRLLNRIKRHTKSGNAL